LSDFFLKKKKKKKTETSSFWWDSTGSLSSPTPRVLSEKSPTKPFFPPHPTYQAVLSPPIESPRRRASAPAYLSHHLPEFIAFMVPNSIGFFTSLAVILLVMDEFPLKSSMGISVRCLVASYVSMLLLIRPTGSKATLSSLAVIEIIVISVYYFSPI
jgi:hypothetical protein